MARGGTAEGLAETHAGQKTAAQVLVPQERLDVSRRAPSHSTSHRWHDTC